jgi:hypothetical protein
VSGFRTFEEGLDLFERPNLFVVHMEGNHSPS